MSPYPEPAAERAFNEQFTRPGGLARTPVGQGRGSCQPRHAANLDLHIARKGESIRGGGVVEIRQEDDLEPFVWPSLLPRVAALPEAPHGNFAIFMFTPSSAALDSVKPHHAISGSVKTTAGIVRPEKSVFSPHMASTAARP